MGGVIGGPIGGMNGGTIFDPLGERFRRQEDLGVRGQTGANDFVRIHGMTIIGKSQDIVELAKMAEDSLQVIKRELNKIGNVLLRAAVAKGISYLLAQSGMVHLAAVVEAAYVANELRHLADAVDRLLR